MQFACADCGFSKDVPDSFAGNVVSCPRCKARSRVPEPAQEFTVVPDAPTANNAGDRVYFQNADRSITITASRAVFGSAMYPMRGVTAVRRMKTPPPGRDGIATILGLVALVGVLFGAIRLFIGDWLLGSVAVAGAVLMCGLLLLIYRQWPDRYVLRLSTAGGDVQALVSEDREEVQSVAHAIGQAIASKATAYT